MMRRLDAALDRRNAALAEHEREIAAMQLDAERNAATLLRLQRIESERRVHNRPLPRAWRHCR